MATDRTLEGYLKEAEQRIDWVLSHPGMSEWLKHALQGARDREPVDVLNDLEMLDHLLRRRAEAQINEGLSRYSAQTPIQD
ncbi:hypothetical protein [Nitratireductor luteus]|uniref:hypothetical protein n=1 Tax=Nitratireductor luteus TaxID=2976980 RepID=UPI00223EBA5B|nr:hypothetical protein [Nitratireductor luteus]